MVLSSVFGLLMLLSYGQLKKFYTIRNTDTYDTVSFYLHATSGNCYLRSGSAEEGEPLSIYGNPDLEKINPSFKYKILNRTCDVSLDLKEFKTSSLSDGLFFAMMRSNEDESNYWKVHLDEKKIFKLDLNYGVGDADIDLSGSLVKTMKIHSGTAMVKVSYDENDPNKIQMDTFLVSVDMGSIVTERLLLSRAKNVIANIGFGNAALDLGDAQPEKCNIQASVGAGSLDILIPKKGTPVIIYLKESPLCGVKIPKGFEEVEKNVYVNMDYAVNAKNILTFNIDVALGSITFKYAD